MDSNTAPKSHALYVGDLAADVTEQNLFEAFNHVGNITCVRICRDVVTRKSLGYGYVNFLSAENAEQALRELNFSPIKGRPCRVMRSFPEPTKRRTGEGNLVVKNVDKKVTDRAFFDYFSQFGSILSSKISKDESGESRGYGFVQFELEEDAKNALSKPHPAGALGDKKIEVEAFVTKNDRVKNEAPVTNLYIKNFPKSWTQETIESTFSKFGTVTSTHVSADAKGRVFAFVNLSTCEEADAALAGLNGLVCLPEGGVKAASEETEEEKAVPALSDVPPLKKEGETDAEEAKEETAEEAKILRMYVSKAQSRTQRDAALRAKFAPAAATDAAVRRAPAPVAEGVTLYIKNLPENCGQAEVTELFSKCGEVVSVYVALTNDKPRVSRGFGMVTMADKESATRAIAELNGHNMNSKPLVVCLHERKEVRIKRLEEEFARTAAAAAAGGNPAGFPSAGPGFPAYGNANQGGHHGGRYNNFNGRMGGRGGRFNNNNHHNNAHHNNANQGGHPAGPLNPMQTAMFHQQYLQQLFHQQQALLRQQQHQAATSGQNAVQAASVMPVPHNVRQLVENMPDGERRQTLGELIFHRVNVMYPAEAAKITGMMLEMHHEELIDMIENPNKLQGKVREALAVLESASKAQ